MAIASVKNKEVGSSVRAKINQAFSDLATAQTDITAIKSNITAIEGDITTLQGDVSTLQSDVSSLGTDVSTLSASLAGKQDKNAISTLLVNYQAVNLNTSVNLNTGQGKTKFFKVRATTTGHTIDIFTGWTGGEIFYILNDATGVEKYELIENSGFTLTYAGSLTADIAAGEFAMIIMTSTNTGIRVL